MTLDFAQASHDLLESVLIKKLAAINATSKSLYIPSKLNLREGWDGRLSIKSLPMRSQIQRAVA